jgi:diadenosine tetraphosphate (Ap4A) HIT family hydrolase
MNRSDPATGFRLDPRLEQDTIAVGDLPLCRLLLMRNADYPWFILVPRRDGAREIHALAPSDRRLLLEESCALAAAMQEAFRPDTLNVAKLGNVVAQLHLHHVARRAGDPAWPGPVWGLPVREMHSEGSGAAVIRELLERLPFTPR